ncbi:hypothetical protein [Jeotgalibacillus campisalis]|uniref:General stress protein 17M-like domain-containing protein n=1 Tax=Jeotgalibacillus campisalis TaxID=220754 RepID=A0A0C2RBV9_9BACL|nr:hypothetical protein [Jeotgalibacillus campisalis]KIL47795.1 hypothetical protein KR50_19620 [Jeotgalibacillus campisalis]
MLNHLQAYFKSENDAETALMKLQRISISEARVDSIPDDGNNKLFIVPAFNLSSAGGNAANAGMVSRNNENEKNQSSENFTHILEFKVSSDETNEALQILGTTDAHLDEETVKGYNQ